MYTTSSTFQMTLLYDFALALGNKLRYRSQQIIRSLLVLTQPYGTTGL